MFVDQMSDCKRLAKELFLEGKGLNNRLVLVLAIFIMKTLKHKSHLRFVIQRKGRNVLKHTGVAI